MSTPSFIPKISWPAGTPTNSYTFASPPKLDPFNEKIVAHNDVTVATMGSRAVAYNFTEKLWTVNYAFISATDWATLLAFFDSVGKLGTKFRYYPSNELSTYYTVELDQYELDPLRNVSDGAGDFLYDLTITYRQVYV